MAAMRIDLTNFSDLMGLFVVLGFFSLIAAIVFAVIGGQHRKKGQEEQASKMKKNARRFLILFGVFSLLCAFSFMASMSDYTRSGRF